MICEFRGKSHFICGLFRSLVYCCYANEGSCFEFFLIPGIFSQSYLNEMCMLRTSDYSDLFIYSFISFM